MQSCTQQSRCKNHFVSRNLREFRKQLPAGPVPETPGDIKADETTVMKTKVLSTYVNGEKVY
jgi:hypothetical protein